MRLPMDMYKFSMQNILSSQQAILAAQRTYPLPSNGKVREVVCRDKTPFFWLGGE